MIFTMLLKHSIGIHRPLRPHTLAMHQRRTFLGLQRPPAPKPQMMGYLVAQGLAIVLLGDYAIAILTNEPTTVRAICQMAGIWKETPPFEKVHHDIVKSTVEE